MGIVKLGHHDDETSLGDAKKPDSCGRCGQAMSRGGVYLPPALAVVLGLPPVDTLLCRACARAAAADLGG